MTIYIILAAIFLTAAILFSVLRRRGTPIPGTWTIFLVLSLALAVTGIWVPLKAPWLVTSIIVWAIAFVVIVFVARFFRTALAIVATIVMLLLIITFGLFSNGIFKTTGNTPVVKEPATTAAITPTPAPTTWLMVSSNYGKNRWFADGIAEIRAAKTDLEATDAAYTWLEKVKTDPNILVGTAKYLLKQDIDKTSLVTADGWATDKAVQLVTELQLLLGKATIVTENAPANGYNSGVSNNTVVAAEVAGIKGDRVAIKITTVDGSVYWVMARCGNIVTPGKPDVPPGKTDETPTPTPTPTPAPTPTLTPKDPAKDPAAQSNAPEGSGLNQDPGPGEYIAPSNMVTPPAESRVNPTPPAATTTTTATTTQTTAKAPTATPMPTPVPVAKTDPTQVGTIPQPNW